MSQPAQCPYLALRYFEERDSYLFYGRDEHVKELLSKLELNRFVAVLGSSGCGKSSLVRAGLLPELKSGMIPSAGHRWKVIEFKPGSSPMQELGGALERGLGITHATDTIAEGPFGIAHAVHSASLESGTNVLVIADQFEEIFSYLREEPAASRGAEAREEAQALVRRLLDSASEPNLRIYVLLVMRSDYLGDCAQFPDLPERMNDSLYLVPRLRRDQLQRAIEAPVGRDIEPAVVQRLLGEVGTDPDQLPRLQHLLSRMWIAADGGRITLEHYVAVGGWNNALEQHLDQIYFGLTKPEQMADGAPSVSKRLLPRYESLPPPPRKACQLIFQRISEIDHGRAVRRWATREQLTKLVGPEAEGVIVRFHHEGFLRLSGLNQDTVEVMHESVLRGWPRLVSWMNEENLAERRLRELAAAARETDWSYRTTEPEKKTVQGIAGLTLQNLIRWRDEFHPKDVWARRYLEHGEFKTALDFLNWCEARELDRQRGARIRNRRLIGGLAIFVIFLLAATASLYMLNSRALKLAREAKARELVADSGEELYIDPEKGILLAMYAVNDAIAYHLPQIEPSATTALHSAVLASRLRITLRGHEYTVHAVAFSPDGRRVATASGDTSARVWDAETGKGLMTLWHEGAVLSVAFSPDGRCLATGSADNTAKVWDAETGRDLVTLRGHQKRVNSVAFSPDGKRLATASDDGTVKVWDGATGEELITLDDGAVSSVAFSPNGKSLATGSQDGTLKIWDDWTGGGGAMTRRWSPGGPIPSVAFSPDGKRLAMAGPGLEARIMDVGTCKELMTFGHEAIVLSVAFSPDGKRLATASGDGTAEIWDAETGAQQVTLRGHEKAVKYVAFSPDGRQLATASYDNTAKIWDADSSPELMTLRGHEDGIRSVAFSPDGERLATASYDKTAKIWDAKTGKDLITLRGHEDTLYSVAFSPDGGRLATASTDNTVNIWDAKTGKELMTLRGHENPVSSVVFSPDGRRLATGSSDKTAKVWDARTGKELMTLRGHEGLIWSVAFSPDGRHLATASLDNTAKIWDTETGKELKTLRGHAGEVYSAAFSLDGRRLATASQDKTAKIWDAETGEELMTLRGHAEWVWSVAFSPDDSRVATASADKTAKIWDAETGKELMTLSGHTAGVYSVSFSPDGKRVATAGEDRTVQVYAVDIHDLLKLAHSRVTRNLTSDECKQYFNSNTCPKLP